MTPVAVETTHFDAETTPAALETTHVGAETTPFCTESGEDRKSSDRPYWINS